MSELMLNTIAWHGQRLEVVLHEHVEVTQLVLLINDLYFAEQAVPAHARHLHFDFPFAPNGNTELVFTLRLEPQGIALLTTPWRVQYGVAASNAPTASTLAPTASVDANFADELAPLLGASIFSPLHQPDGLIVPVTVIVPIYNAAMHVQRCIESLIQHTQVPAHLLLIDDASTDLAIAPLLARYLDTPGITVLRNTQNLGYTRNIALGLSHVPDGDVVVLNADTEVGPNWLCGLRRAAYARVDIGTATAVSDNAGAFSVPELEQDNPLPTTWSLTQTQRALWQHAGLVTPALPTGNGFCMYVKRAMLARIGGPDVEAFAHGYGEENDWCQRAERVGFVHVIAGNVLVRHARSASFGEERRESLGRTGMAVLRERYPHYEAAVSATLFSFERRVLDWRVRHIYHAAAHTAITPPRPRVLWVIGIQDDVSNDIDMDMGLTSEFDVWMLVSSDDALLLKRYSATGWCEVQRALIPPCLEFAPATWLRYDELFASWIQHYAIELMHLIDTRGHSGHLMTLSQSLALPLFDASHPPALLFHDKSMAQHYNAVLNQQRFFAQL